MLPQANHAGERLHDAPADAHPPARQQHEHRQHEQHEHEHEQRGERGDCVKRGHSPHDGIRRRSAAVPAAAAATAAAAAGRRRAAALSGTIRRSTPFFWSFRCRTKGNQIQLKSKCGPSARGIYVFLRLLVLCFCCLLTHWHNNYWADWPAQAGSNRKAGKGNNMELKSLLLLSIQAQMT